MSAFISEDDLKTFEGWMTFQAIDPTALSAEQLETWRELFEESRTRAEAAPKVGLMKLSVLQSGESRYAVAIKDGGDLWLTLWVRRSRKGEFFVMVPRGCKDWDPHTSYHLDGTLHVKSFGEKFGRRKKQPLGGVFQGVENLGGYAGHGSGAVCDRSSFTGLLKSQRACSGRSMERCSCTCVSLDGCPTLTTGPIGMLPYSRFSMTRCRMSSSLW